MGFEGHAPPFFLQFHNLITCLIVDDQQKLGNLGKKCQIVKLNVYFYNYFEVFV